MQEETPKQATLDQRYLRMARIWAENSYCRRRKVGALVVKEKMIISDGYNGTPSGFENVCEDDNNVTKPYVLHAEANAITKLARSSNNSDGATLYVTSSPCIECSKLIIQAGIKRVVYDEQYRLDDGIQLLRRAGIEVVHMPIEGSHMPIDGSHMPIEGSHMPIEGSHMPIDGSHMPIDGSHMPIDEDKDKQKQG